MENYINEIIKTDDFINKSIIVSIENNIEIIDFIRKEIATSRGFTKLKLHFLKLKTKYILRKQINLIQNKNKTLYLYLNLINYIF